MPLLFLLNEVREVTWKGTREKVPIAKFKVDYHNTTVGLTKVNLLHQIYKQHKDTM